MHVLRKLTGCLSSTTCLNDQNPQEENIDSTTNILSRLSLIEDRTIENKVVVDYRQFSPTNLNDQ